MWILILYYVADADESCILEKLIRLLIVILIILRTWYMQIIWNITPAISLCFHYHFMAASQDNMTTSLVAFAWELWILKLTFVELLLSSLCNWALILNIPLLISPWAYTVWNLCTVNSMHATYDSALHSALWIAEFFFPCLWFQKQRTSGLGMILHLLSFWFFSSCSQHQLTVQRKFMIF